MSFGRPTRWRQRRSTMSDSTKARERIVTPHPVPAREIAVATETPSASLSWLARLGLLGLYVGVVPVALGLATYPLLARLDAAFGLEAPDPRGSAPAEHSDSARKRGARSDQTETSSVLAAARTINAVETP